MHIDWGQILTHIVGFLIAIWLVRRYAWDKMLQFIEHRRETISASFSEIERGQEEIAAQKEHYEKELENIEVARRSRIQDGAREGEKLAAEIREEARQVAVDMRQKAKQDISLELDKANVILKDRMIDAVLVTTEKILGEKLDRERHARLIDDFLGRMKVE
jgi:F-type H+-transporting ATPase subunit b